MGLGGNGGGEAGQAGKSGFSLIIVLFYRIDYSWN